jgi:hypothetical protein
MIVCFEGSSVDSAVRTETVFPAPTSPVTTPRDRSAMHRLMRATASLWDACRWSMPRREVAAERHARESVVGLQLLDHADP